MSLVLDTGPIVAILNAGDPSHEACRQLIQGTDEELVVPAPVMVEVDYWCRKELGLEALASFVADLAAGAYVWFEPGMLGLERAHELERRYQDLDLGFVDASVIATCEILDEDRVATLDRRHFGAVVPGHRPYLTLVP
jgi:predicted nucleic acid-binding protein